MKETFKVNHPIIKEITIGDYFLLGDEDTIVRFDSHGEYFIMEHIRGKGLRGYKSWNYDERLCFRRSDYLECKYLDIKCKMPSLQEKLNLL